MLLVIGAFIGSFLYISELGTNAGVTVDPKYNDTYNQIIETQTDIDTNINDIQTATDAITEAPSGFITALNGFKALGNTILLFKNLVANAIDLVSIIFLGSDILPSWALNTIRIGLIATIVILLIAWWKGEPVSQWLGTIILQTLVMVIK